MQLIVGGHWSPAWTDSKGKNSQLHLLLVSYPPPHTMITSYRYLLNSALSAGCDLTLSNGMGQNPVMVFAERLSKLLLLQHPESVKLFQVVIHSHDGIAALEANDWSGKAAHNISCSNRSCLFACRSMMQEAIRNRRLHTHKKLSQSLDKQFSTDYCVESD